MKKILLPLIALIVFISAVGAETQERNKLSLLDKSKNSGFQRFIDRKESLNANSGFVRINPANHSQAIRMTGNARIAPTQARSVLKVNSNLSVPEGLIGTFYCKGLSYFGGTVTGETVIRADASDPNKIWLSNLIPDASNQDVYGIVSSDQKTINIPQGQVAHIYKDSTATYLSIYGSTDDITGEFDATTGVITITSDYWGSQDADGYWGELFEGTVTYTRSDMMPPTVSYRQPQGALFLGMMPETWEYYSDACIVGSPDTTWIWRNTNIEEGVSYSWKCTDSITNTTIHSDSDSLIMNVDGNYYGTPQLTATDSKNGLSTTFVLGVDYDNEGHDSYTLAGGNGAIIGFDAACDYGAANLDNGFTVLSPRNGVYYFGTGMSDYYGNNLESLLLKYDEPLSTLYFEGVNVYLCAFNAPDNTPLTLNIVYAEKDENGRNKKGALIASKTIKAKDATPILTSDGTVAGYTLEFSGFETKDEDGLVVSNDYLEVNKAFFLELTGFNVDGVELGVCSEEINPSDGDTRSRFIESGNDSIFGWTSNRQTMYMNLAGAAYPLIWTDKDTVVFYRDGGTDHVEVTPFIDTLYFADQVFPSWLHAEIVDEEYSDNIWGGKLKITVDPIGNNAARSYDVVLNSTSCSRKITVMQSTEVSVPVIKTEKAVYAVRNKNGFLVTYPSDAKTMSVYTATGAFVGKYDLPSNLNYQLSSSSLAHGVYILKLQGDNYSKSIKISR